MKKKRRPKHSSGILAYGVSFLVLLFLLLVLLTEEDALRGLRGQLLPSAALKAVPSSGTQNVGTDFIVDLVVDTGGESVGGIYVDVTYSNNLALANTDALGSVFDQAVLSPAPLRNQFHFARVRFDSGYSGAEGQLLRLTFTPLSAGVGTVTINNEDRCALAYTNVGGSPQAANYPELLLQVNHSIVFTTLISQHTTGYDSNHWDFQMLVAEDGRVAGSMLYYFYVEVT